jgi:hypothetical protein
MEGLVARGEGDLCGVAANAWDVYGRPPIPEDEIARETERLRR